ncbi:hypothetical protein [Actinomadura citrea]|uniref:Uncharacterized protein n=1 Tax=Actinomadura citrea TaxID=46158 RepID=A0A7Y9GDR4_9ACTN|nr:hypothetical protein [Actinomadura citrea]NYE14667.1 hypothetical protein [Actinomadura citrea]GGT83747.1 hypothetical protein GCM10010177_48690 [Actinomadura citrea]
MAGEARAGAERVVGVITANISLAVGALFYMGWCYTNAVYGYFRVNPLDLEIGPTEYVLRSAGTVFSSTLVFGAIVWLIVTTLPQLRLTELIPGRAVPGFVRRPLHRAAALAGDPLARQRAGLMLLLAAGALVILSVTRITDNLYLTLALTAAGVLLLTRSAGTGAYAVGLITAAACALWATGVYAKDEGTAEAHEITRGLRTRTAVVVYTTKPLALSGPGVTAERLPKGNMYAQRYQGLRLLIGRAGRYYVLPVGWRPGVNATYLLRESDSMRIEILPGS